MKFQQLFEYNRQKTLQNFQAKLLAAMKRDNFFWRTVKDLPEEQQLTQLLDSLEGIDPTKMKKYTQWIVKQYTTNAFRVEDAGRIQDVLTYFHTIKPRLARENISADINQYTLQKLEIVMDNLQKVSLDDDSDDQSIDGIDAKVLYNGPLGLLTSPNTQEASCELGKGTKWCTAASGHNLFNNYSSLAPLYIWRDRNGKKYQFWVDDTGGDEYMFMDSADRDMFEYDYDTLDTFRNSHPVLKKLFRDILEPKIIPHYYLAFRYGFQIPGGWSQEVLAKHPELDSFANVIKKYGADSKITMSVLEKVGGRFTTEIDSKYDRYNVAYNNEYPSQPGIVIEYFPDVSTLLSRGDVVTVPELTAFVDGIENETIFDNLGNYDINEHDQGEFIQRMSNDQFNQFKAFLVEYHDEFREIASQSNIPGLVNEISRRDGLELLITEMDTAINSSHVSQAYQSGIEQVDEILNNIEMKYTIIQWTRDDANKISIADPVYLVMRPMGLNRFINENGEDYAMYLSGDLTADGLYDNYSIGDLDIGRENIIRQDFDEFDDDSYDFFFERLQEIALDPVTESMNAKYNQLMKGMKK